MARVERDVVRMVKAKDIDPEHRDTAKLLLTAMNFGSTNVGKLAALSGLARDRFVIPRARLLKDQGVWTEDGKVAFEYPDGPPTHTMIEFIMHVLLAEGILRRVPTADSAGVVEPHVVEEEGVV